MASYCAACGASLPGGARFCSTCGKAVTEPGAVGFPGICRGTASLIRPRAGRKLAGVCQGLANQYGWDVTLTRVIAVLLAMLVFPIGAPGLRCCYVAELVPESHLDRLPSSETNTLRYHATFSVTVRIEASLHSARLWLLDMTDRSLPLSQKQIGIAL